MKVKGRHLARVLALALIVTAFSGLAFDCGIINYPTNPGPPGDCTVTWTPYYSGYDAWTITDAHHEYRDNFTLQAKKTDSCDGHSIPLLKQVVHSIGQEECEPQPAMQTDWNKTETDPTTDPWTLEAYGGYAPNDECLLGHWVTASGYADVEDASVGVNENGLGGFYHCYLLYRVAGGLTGPPVGC